jgi:hypothetical protein
LGFVTNEEELSTETYEHPLVNSPHGPIQPSDGRLLYVSKEQTTMALRSRAIIQPTETNFVESQ